MGNALKLASSPSGLDKCIQFDYSDGGEGLTYYDVTDGPGHPFDLAATADNGCPSVGCGQGGDCQKVKACGTGTSFHVTACP